VSAATCDEVRELAPELALGIAAGEQRARALVHMATCTACRTMVEDMSRAADSMLLLAPEKEPPVGFEAHAARRVRGMRPRHRLRLAVGFASVVLVSVGITAAVMEAATARDRDLAERYLALVEGRSGGELVAAHLFTADGGPAGQAFAYQGKTSWVFLVVNAKAGSGVHDVVLLSQGQPTGTRVGQMRVVDGRGSWGSTTGLNLRGIKIQLLSGDGRPTFEGKFPAPGD
jgi:hypothetical protein